MHKCMHVGPTCRVLFRDMPIDVFAEASNTNFNLVVVLDSFITECECIGI